MSGVDIHSFISGPFQTNTYLLVCNSECWIVDPAGPAAQMVNFIESSALNPLKILLTHGHADHISGVNTLMDRFADIKLACPAEDAFMLTDPQANLSSAFGVALTTPPADEQIQPGQSLSLGDLTWSVLDTSGHTPGGVSYYCAEADTAIVGDTLFAGSIGRTDLPGGETRRLVKNIRNNLMSLPEETRVLPGHGPETTIGLEKRTNPFLGATRP